MCCHIDRILTLLVAIALLGTFSTGTETLSLQPGRGLESVSSDRQGKYLLAVAQIKEMVNMGQTGQVRKALAKLKEDYPEIAGADLDAFIEAEILFCKGKFGKAARSYDKLLAEYPETKLYQAVLDRQFAIGTAYLAGQKKRVLKIFKIKGYSTGERIMERIKDRSGQAPIAVKAALAIATSLEKRGKFEDAYYQWSEISSAWPTGEIGKQALLGMARCKYAAYKGPNYDASALVSAKSYYVNFKSRYPKDAGKISVDEILKQIDEDLAYKQFSIGLYYEKTDDRLSANLYYQMVLDNCPTCWSATMAKQNMDDSKLGAEKAKK